MLERKGAILVFTLRGVRIRKLLSTPKKKKKKKSDDILESGNNIMNHYLKKKKKIKNHKWKPSSSGKGKN